MNVAVAGHRNMDVIVIIMVTVAYVTDAAQHLPHLSTASPILTR